MEVRIFMEGGGAKDPNARVETVNNSNSLRRAISQLLLRGLPENTELLVSLEGGYSGAKKRFNANTDCLLLIDLDAPPPQKSIWLRQHKLEDKNDRVFFMVQTMEAWILSQPTAIEECFKEYKIDPNAIIAEDIRIKDIDPQSIETPDVELDAILKQYFRNENGGRTTQIKYLKNVNASDLIDQLDIHQLRKTFSDVDKLLDKIVSLNS